MFSLRSPGLYLIKGIFLVECIFLKRTSKGKGRNKFVSVLSFEETDDAVLPRPENRVVNLK